MDSRATRNAAMSVLGAVACGLAAGVAVPPRWRFRAAIAVAAGAALPVLCLTVLVVAGLVRWRRLLSRRRLDERAAAADLPLLAELLGLALAGGLSVPLALERAGPRLHPGLGGEVTAVLRRAQVVGLAGALSAAVGVARPLWLRMARALVTGAPLADSLAAFVAAQRHTERMDRIASARRLPVKLMVPVALLILPGFVILTLGPTLLSALDELSLPLAPGRLPG